MRNIIISMAEICDSSKVLLIKYQRCIMSKKYGEFDTHGDVKFDNYIENYHITASSHFLRIS